MTVLTAARDFGDFANISLRRTFLRDMRVGARTGGCPTAIDFNARSNAGNWTSLYSAFGARVHRCATFALMLAE